MKVSCHGSDNSRALQLPQDWPPHLHALAGVTADPRHYPRTSYVLDFNMPGDAFEQLCWWLLSKEHTLVGCHRLGRSGTFQGGIDLFAEASDDSHALHVFECKAWRNFTSSSLNNAINDFLNGPWAPLSRSFTLILAQQDLGPMGQHWIEARQRLRKAGIEGEVWTGHDLTLKFQRHPDLLAKFFPGAHIEAFANLWQERVGFFDLVSKSVFDPRPHIAHQAKALVGQRDKLSEHLRQTANAPGTLTGPLDDYTSIRYEGSHWLYHGPWFSLSVFLPDEESPRATAAFDFHQRDLQGVTLTVDHQWLLTRFLFNQVALPSRNFIAGQMPDDKERYIVDLLNGRLLLEKRVAQELADVADLLTDVMRTALQALEQAWSAVDFPFLAQGSSHEVALGAMRHDAWQWLTEFAQIHDSSNGDSPWHMFDGHPNFLKPFHSHATERFDANHHAVIAIDTNHNAAPWDQVNLLWKPHHLTHRELSSRGWWPCETTLRWLNEELLPQVRRWKLERASGSSLGRLIHRKRLKAYAQLLDERLTIRDLREPPLLRDNQWTSTLTQAVEQLSFFFSSASSHNSHLPIQAQNIADLYRTVAMLAIYRRGYAGYIAASLSLARPDDHQQLIKSIHDYINHSKMVTNANVVDHALRAIKESLQGSDDFLAPKERQAIQQWLLPFARIYDDGVLVQRHLARR